MLWDEGTWEPVGDPDQGLAKGNLKFILHGKKLHGKWVLVRMGGKAANEAKPNWLLIKEHDEYEQTADDEPITEKEPNSVLTQRDIEAIARDEDHVWQSNRPESSGGHKSLTAKPARFAPFAPAATGQERVSAGVYPPAVSLRSARAPSGKALGSRTEAGRLPYPGAYRKKARFVFTLAAGWTGRTAWLWSRAS